MTFIVRAFVDERGQVRGLLMHSKSGSRTPFGDAAELGRLIAAMAGPRPDGLARLEGPDFFSLQPTPER